jgi:hypothetical protein
VICDEILDEGPWFDAEDGIPENVLIAMGLD